MSNFEDIMPFIEFAYFDGSANEKFESVDQMSEIMLIQDHVQYGRCYTINPTLKMIRKGIYKHQFSEL